MDIFTYRGCVCSEDAQRILYSRCLPTRLPRPRTIKASLSTLPPRGSHSPKSEELLCSAWRTPRSRRCQPSLLAGGPCHLCDHEPQWTRRRVQGLTVSTRHSGYPRLSSKTSTRMVPLAVCCTRVFRLKSLTRPWRTLLVGLFSPLSLHV